MVWREWSIRVVRNLWLLGAERVEWGVGLVRGQCLVWGFRVERHVGMEWDLWVVRVQRVQRP